MEEKTESGRGSETAQLGEAEASARHPHAPPPTPQEEECVAAAGTFPQSPAERACCGTQAPLGDYS